VQGGRVPGSNPGIPTFDYQTVMIYFIAAFLFGVSKRRNESQLLYPGEDSLWIKLFLFEFRAVNKNNLPMTTGWLFTQYPMTSIAWLQALIIDIQLKFHLVKLQQNTC